MLIYPLNVLNMNVLVLKSASNVGGLCSREIGFVYAYLCLQLSKVLVVLIAAMMLICGPPCKLSPQ
jgi:hypothetical protein